MARLVTRANVCRQTPAVPFPTFPGQTWGLGRPSGLLACRLLQQELGAAMPRRDKKRGTKVRYAVVGAGHVAQKSILPGFAGARRNSELVALISSDPEKRRALGRRYGLEHVGDYGDLEQVVAAAGADAVYIATPNTVHREYTERAARAGLHVLCEKPLAPTAAECRAMMETVSRAGVKLMVAYRLHFEEANLDAVRIVRSGKLGRPVLLEAMLTRQARGGDSRTRADLGGGALLDVGIYCVNAARYLFGEEPTDVFGHAIIDPDPRFQGGVDATTVALLRFPGGGIASIGSSQAAAPASWFRLIGEKGSLEVEEAFSYAGARKRRLTLDGRTRERTFRSANQFGAEILYFSRCILEDREPEPDGLEGLADVRVMEAIRQSASARAPVTLEPLAKPRGPTPDQRIVLRPVRRPPVSHAPAPKR
jgi:predicted dehydrogenase